MKKIISVLLLLSSTSFAFEEKIPSLQDLLTQRGFRDCEDHVTITEYVVGYRGAETDDDGIAYCHSICGNATVSLSCSTGFYSGKKYISFESPADSAQKWLQVRSY
jgi:hypothetical protein